MEPEDVARRHPRLFHLTDPESESGIRQHGLLSTEALIKKFERSAPAQDEFLARIRTTSISLHHPDVGRAVITDNTPLNGKKLAACLDDGLTPEDWMRLLNRRVFFWPNLKHLQTLKGARLNRYRRRIVLVFDTAALVQCYYEQTEIAPINTGSPLYNPVRRGRATFTPIKGISYESWRRMRGLKSLDKIKEVTVLGGIPDASRFIIDSYTL